MLLDEAAWPDWARVSWNSPRTKQKNNLESNWTKKSKKKFEGLDLPKNSNMNNRAMSLNALHICVERLRSVLG